MENTVTVVNEPFDMCSGYQDPVHIVVQGPSASITPVPPVECIYYKQTRYKCTTILSNEPEVTSNKQTRRAGDLVHSHGGLVDIRGCRACA